MTHGINFLDISSVLLLEPHQVLFGKILVVAHRRNARCRQILFDLIPKFADFKHNISLQDMLQFARDVFTSFSDEKHVVCPCSYWFLRFLFEAKRQLLQFGFVAQLVCLGQLDELLASLLRHLSPLLAEYRGLLDHSDLRMADLHLLSSLVQEMNVGTQWPFHRQFPGCV